MPLELLYPLVVGGGVLDAPHRTLPNIPIPHPPLTKHMDYLTKGGTHMKLTFLGADREVTGSCTQVEAAGHRFLVDCGMEQGRDVYENADLPYAPGTYEALLLTHAHIDHSGRIPYLYKNGYRGPVYTTEATRDLCGIMLEDSAHIQEQEA